MMKMPMIYARMPGKKPENMTEEDPDDAQYRRIHIQVLTQSTTDAGKDLIAFASVELLGMHTIQYSKPTILGLLHGVLLFK